jgi:hypothetical protein
MKKALLLVTLALLLTACGAAHQAKITSVKYVDTINTGGVFVKYEGKDNIEIRLDVTFDESIVSGLDPESDTYRKEVFGILTEGAHLYLDDQEVKRAYGYWPQEAGSDYAKDVTLFYVVPSSHSPDSLRFVYDGAVLGEGATGIDTKIKPE